MVLPKRCIEIRDHAFHRAVERFGLTKAKATATIRRILREGTWFQSPDNGVEYLVLGRFQNKPACAIAKIEMRKVVVTTVFQMRNTARIRAYQQHSPGVDAATVVQRYGIQG